MRILLTGGGTGGHVYPALTIADEIRRQDPAAEFLFLGVQGGIESDLVPRTGLPFAPIRAGGLVGTSLAQRAAGAWKMAAGVVQALGHLRRFRPDVVLATGGYVSGPVLLAALLSRVPTAVWEGNAYPGSTVRLFSRWAQAVFIPYPEARRHFPAGARLLAIGNPVRRQVLEADRDQARAQLGIGPHEQLVLVVPGSIGARGINRAMVEAVPLLLARPTVRILHVTGPRQFDEVRDLYRQSGLDPDGTPGLSVRSYLYDMPVAQAAADVAITRAGATTMAEIAARGLPAVVIPFPYATHNHQEFNARALERRGGVVVMLESELTGQGLAEVVAALLAAPERRAAMATALRGAAWRGAAEEIARRVLALARTRSRA